MSVQHLSEIESSKRDPRLSSIERIADTMELAVMLVPENMAPDIRRYRQATVLIPPGFKGQISWGEVDSRSFLRIAHGYLLGLMHRGDGKAAKALAKKLLARCPACRLPERTCV